MRAPARQCRDGETTRREQEEKKNVRSVCSPRSTRVPFRLNILRPLMCWSRVEHYYVVRLFFFFFFFGEKAKILRVHPPSVRFHGLRPISFYVFPRGARIYSFVSPPLSKTLDQWLRNPRVINVRVVCERFLRYCQCNAIYACLFIFFVFFFSYSLSFPAPSSPRTRRPRRRSTRFFSFFLILNSSGIPCTDLSVKTSSKYTVGKSKRPKKKKIKKKNAYIYIYTIFYNTTRRVRNASFTKKK